MAAMYVAKGGLGTLQSPLLNVIFSGLTYQNLWKVPDGDKADLSQTFQSGQTLPLSWEALNESTNDLWVTTFNYNEVKFSSLITRTPPPSTQNLPFHEAHIHS
ncbi:hypothetical protein SLS56_010011 [Neofusicoccum ribis]|uniref:Uncharacterized protein n=1 Tax=Neofusicoccum ribis TaxID=45134 RepID=A0ABR3SFM9_9PEZI